MSLLNLWPSNSPWGFSFAHPWLLLLLLLVPLLAWLRGQRGAAAALVFSSTATLRSLGKRSTSRAGASCTACFISRSPFSFSRSPGRSSAKA